jgi:hypothetical protein
MSVAATKLRVKGDLCDFIFLFPYSLLRETPQTIGHRFRSGSQNFLLEPHPWGNIQWAYRQPDGKDVPEVLQLFLWNNCD